MTTPLEVARNTPIKHLVVYERPLRQNLNADIPSFLDRFRRAVEDGKNEAATAMFFREMVGMDEEALDAFQSTPAWQQ